MMPVRRGRLVLLALAGLLAVLFAALAARSPVHRAQQRELSVLPGQTTAVQLVLEREDLGQVRGRLVAGAGPLDKIPRVLLRSLDAPWRPERTARVTADGPSACRFSFSDVPHGHYRILIEPMDGCVWSPWQAEIFAPVPDFVFRRTEERALRLEFRATDAVAGTRIDAFDVTLVVDGAERTVAARSGTAVFRGVPPGARLRWELAAQGFVPAAGDASALEHEGLYRRIDCPLARP